MSRADVRSGDPEHAELRPCPRTGPVGLEGYGVLDYRDGGPPTWAEGRAGRPVWFSGFAEARDWADRELNPPAEQTELEPAESAAMTRLRAGTRLINSRPAWRM
ncbi:hypothetical protein [Streptomyces sp. NPDC051567]|uniref:hypothetical protein n=1 Tax=Streptomyces sp. NPDC051567 TaxID=3365660 RepID=UPI00379F64EA